MTGRREGRDQHTKQVEYKGQALSRLSAHRRSLASGPAWGAENVGLSQGLNVLGGSQQLPMLLWLFSVVRRQGRTAEGETAPETLTIGHHLPQSLRTPSEGGTHILPKDWTGILANSCKPS